MDCVRQRDDDSRGAQVISVRSISSMSLTDCCSGPDFDQDLVQAILVEVLQNVKTTTKQAQILHGRDFAIMGVSVPTSAYGFVLEAAPRAFKVLEPELDVNFHYLVTTTDRAVAYTYPPDSCARFRYPSSDFELDILIFERTADVRRLLHAEIDSGSFLRPSPQVVDDFGEGIVNAIRSLLQYRPTASTVGCTVMLAGMLSPQEVRQIKEALEKVRHGLSANVKITGEDYSRTAAMMAACIARMAFHPDPDCTDIEGCTLGVDHPLPMREL